MPGVLHYPNYLIPCRRRRKRSVYTRELSQTVINDEGTRSNEILSFSLSASDVAFCALLPTKTLHSSQFPKREQYEFYVDRDVYNTALLDFQ
jgi:hypothetical protein